MTTTTKKNEETGRLTLQEAMIGIQSELKAPKSQWNAFGKYKFRNCEDILEAVKPLLKKYGCVLTISDDLIFDQNDNLQKDERRCYIKATATIRKGDESISNTAFAREELTKKGMDAAQLTGATSSYARKYALNGLLCIDDNKDPDTTNNGGKSAPETTQQPVQLERNTEQWKNFYNGVAQQLSKCKSKDEVTKLFQNFVGGQETKSYHLDKDETFKRLFNERFKQL